MSLLLGSGEWDEVTPAAGGWRYLSFRIVRVDGLMSLDTGDNEIVVVPLGGAAIVHADGVEAEVGGREDVFAGLPRSVYLPRETRAELEGVAELALCGARAERRRDVRPIPPEEVGIEVRGSGNATRQYGYHTTAAAHGYDLYYLNALAGDRRAMQAADDPDLAWVRSARQQLQPDPRIPMVT
jgi:5-deoxy-D-glucuronate isomerase